MIKQNNFGCDKKDEGMCLTMHQPWASLLVYGIKRIEGRGWNTDYRGRLWIHAASKIPEPDLIKSTVQSYTEIRNGWKFPDNYPTSCLLGCVDVVDCISISEYVTLFSNPELSLNKYDLSVPVYDEDTGSEYLFICVNPQRLVMPFNMPGKSKLWKLPKATLQAAQKGLKPITLSINTAPT
jgi:hypothetical protein